MLELWGMRSNSPLPSLQGSLWPEVEVLDKVLSMGLIELRLCIYAKLNCVKWNCFLY